MSVDRIAVLAWHYYPQLLIKVLIVALGLSLVARALLPARAPLDQT